MAVDKVLYRAQAKATGGRDGRATSADDQIDLKLTTPKALGGAGGDGTNPEQLFAAGYSACFIGAMKVVAGKQKVSLPQDLSVTGEVGIGPSGEAFGIEVTLNISLPGMDKDQADKLVEAAHQVCPYSNATRGNIDVALNVEV
ncbi:Organic hydroperoxide resistance protein [Salinisphaera shabanensis E1L3A]|uniref:Organic hydroperoxide resistance protein n=1 Tax=Salinisphaera shabanensis E1L3A TaxID=1033802 RepID=U2ENS4_9GAMM|nr:organic hydroperoxide resistance protein [Salinisphaera shabanensis]ERJ19480.1 Organic hydroperoxide resistance protein [Salinisphaera shabanensis E1L3A]